MADKKTDIKWYYDEVLMSKGNKVTIIAIHNEGATSSLKDAEGNPITYKPRVSLENAQKSNDQFNGSAALLDEEKLETLKETYASNAAIMKVLNEVKFINRAVVYNSSASLTESEYNSLGSNKIFFAPSGGESKYSQVIDYSNARTDQESIVASMTEFSLGINNQWIEGNGADSMFSGSIDAAAQLTQGGAVAGFTNTTEALYRAAGKESPDWLKKVKALNQVHYRSSTQFIKAYKGTNISIPISITRTFVQDQYGLTNDSEIAKVAKWALGTELDLAGFTNTQDVINKGKEHVQTGIGDVPESVMNYINNTGGVVQKAPLGYIYSSTYWKKMMSAEDLGSIPGTLMVKLSNGITIPDLIVSDMSVNQSQTQVLTKYGLRPLTVTVSIQLLPVRCWGVQDALKILGYMNLDPSKVTQAGDVNATSANSLNPNDTNLEQTNQNRESTNIQTQTQSDQSEGRKAAEQEKIKRDTSADSTLSPYLTGAPVNKPAVTAEPSVWNSPFNVDGSTGSGSYLGNFSQNYGNTGTIQ